MRRASGKFYSNKPLAVDSDFGTASPSNVSFDTPNLLYLNYSDFVAGNYPLVKLDSLVEARLDVGSNTSQMHARDSEEYEVPWDATNLIMGIHNVQTLHLTSATIEVLFLSSFLFYGYLLLTSLLMIQQVLLMCFQVIEDFCKTVPVFHNLNHLSIESDDERGWQALPLLLINCPNLQTLVFHVSIHAETKTLF